MMYRSVSIALIFACASIVHAADEIVEIGGMKSKAPADWKKEKTTSEMRLCQFKLPKADGDKEDAELVVFFFKNASGSIEENLKRQLNAFEAGEGKEKVVEKIEKIKIGGTESTYQSLSGTFLSKFPPFAPNAKITKKPDYQQLYVILKNDSGDYYFKVVGPSKTVDLHKKEFDEWLKNFK